MPSGSDMQDKIHQRCTWLSTMVFGSTGAIDQEAVQALCSIDFSRALEITKDLETKGTVVANSSNYIKAAVSREPGGGKGRAGKGHEVSSDGFDVQYKVHQRCTWLSAMVFGGKGAINDEAVQALSSIDFKRAMEITKELESKGLQVANPSNYICAAVSREPGGAKAKGGKGKVSGAWLSEGS